MAEGWFNNYNQDTYRTADYDSELASERGRHFYIQHRVPPQ